MANVSANNFLDRFGNETISCNPYALAKLGVEKGHCVIKIDDYMILCAPYQFGFKKSLFIASLSQQEMLFFKKYVNGNVGLTITIMPNNGKYQKPLNILIHCILSLIHPVKGRENVGLFELNYKKIHDDFIKLLGKFCENQNLIKTQYEAFAQTPIKITAETAKLIGYNHYATINDIGKEPSRIQVYHLSSKKIEYLEAASAQMREAGTSVVYHLYFQKYRVKLNGVIQSCAKLANGLLNASASISFSPEIVEIISDYWDNVKNSKTK